MKVLFLEAVQNFGGARKSTIELAKRLESVGNEVLIVDFWGACKPFVEMVSKNNLSLKILDFRKKPFILYSPNKIKSLFNNVSYFIYEKKVKRNLAQIIREFSPDIISVNNCKCLSIIPYKGNFDIHYIARGWFNANSIPFRDKYTIKKYKSKIKFFAVSQATRQAIYTGGFAMLNNIHVITDSIDSNFVGQIRNENVFKYWYESTNRPFFIHHCGGFLETKGQHISLEVAKKMKKNNIDFELIFTGIIYEGEESRKYYQKLISEIESNNLQDVVKIILNPTNIMEYFYKSDVLLLPSYTEGLPRVILEAMSFGKPVIANPVGGIIEIVISNYTGFITNFNSIEDYYNYLIQLINNKQKYKNISSNCIKLIEENYSIINQEQSIIKYYTRKDDIMRQDQVKD